MANDKRFIDHVDFREVYNERVKHKEFIDKYRHEFSSLNMKQGKFWNEELEIPDPKSEKGKIALDISIERMNLHLKQHFDEECKKEIDKIRNETSAKFSKFKIKRRIEEQSSTVS